jgi:hypothetical protein
VAHAQNSYGPVQKSEIRMKPKSAPTNSGSMHQLWALKGLIFIFASSNNTKATMENLLKGLSRIFLPGR